MPTRKFETASVDEVLKHCVVDVPESGPAKPVTEIRQRRTIIVVDDEFVIADTLVAILNQSGFSALAAYDGESAFELISARVPDLLITDICMPGMNGIELAIRVRKHFSSCKVLLFSGHAASTNLIDEARTSGYEFDFLSKPVHPRDLLERLNRAA
jgi:DNA-binding NtrC family response regulator